MASSPVAAHGRGRGRQARRGPRRNPRRGGRGCRNIPFHRDGRRRRDRPRRVSAAPLPGPRLQSPGSERSTCRATRDSPWRRGRDGGTRPHRPSGRPVRPRHSPAPAPRQPRECPTPPTPPRRRASGIGRRGRAKKSWPAGNGRHGERPRGRSASLFSLETSGIRGKRPQSGAAWGGPLRIPEVAPAASLSSSGIASSPRSVRVCQVSSTRIPDTTDTTGAIRNCGTTAPAPQDT